MFDLRRAFGRPTIPFLITCAVVIGPATGVQAATGSADGATRLFADTANLDTRGAQLAPETGVTRTRYVKVDFAGLGLADGPRVDRMASKLALDFFPDEGISYTAILDRVERASDGRVAWIGHLEGSDERVILIVDAKRQQITGNLTTSAGILQVRPTKIAGVHGVRRVDPASYPEDLVLQPLAEPASPSSENAADPAKADSGARIDVMVVYTAAAKTAAGGTAQIEALIDLALTETNTGYSDSGVTPTMRIVHKAEVSYTESGDFVTDLNRLQSTSDGYVDNVHSLRDTHGADMVAMIIEGSQYCGIAYQIGQNSSSGASSAFQVTARTCATGYYSFGHEFGHLQGARHDWFVDNTNNSPFTYNHGFLSGTSSSSFRTIMGYGDGCSGCTRINRWSNPDRTYNSVATGVAEGQANAADNRKTLNNTAVTVANYRQEVGGVPGAATLVSPTGTTSAASPTFTWNRVTGATWYYVWVDTAAGASAIREWVTDAAVCSGTTCSVSRPLAVGSYSWWIQTWNSSGYGPWSSSLSFNRVCAGATTAMTSPTPSSTLTGTSVTFSWAGNPCATSYYLYVGTTPGGFNLYNASTGLTQSALVTGLPKDGSTVYVRLWTLADAVWTYVDYSYTAYTADLGRLKSPVSGSLLTGTSTTLEWLPGSGVTQYWLSVGTTQGGSSIFGGSVGTQLSTTITGIPTATCTAVPAFTSPLAGSVLSGSSVAFSWSAPCTGPTIHVRLWSLAGGVWDYIDYALYTSGYNFRLGRAPGRADLHRDTQGTSTSSPTISSLPTNGSTLFGSLAYLDGGVWKETNASFTAAGSTAGFTEEFATAGSPVDWYSVSGDWLVGSDYLSYGVPDDGSSVAHNSSYTTLDYSATVKRDSTDSFANRLWVRGDNGPLYSTSGWQNGYQFQYSTNGSYSVFKRVGGATITVQNWTSTGAIVQGANWNTLRVKASGSSLSFYINGTLVWTGTDPSLARGRVGVGFYGSGGFHIDRATLSTTLLADDDQRLSPEQEALNRAAQQGDNGGDVNQAPPRGR